jgi:flavin reductase (DIM6/NTAB) family NADH-FMN oxidoreductase RutF
MAQFRPLRDAFGAFATGVTIVTAADMSGRPFGFTANSFASVSLDPPLLLVCPARGASSLPAITETGRFAVHVLARGQQPLAERFSRRHSDRFAGLDWSRDPGGVPTLAGACARFACTLEHRHNGGDHEILVGRVQAFETDPGLDPLLFVRGAYV